MTSRHAQLAAGVLLLIGSIAAADAQVDRLIRQLADPDPAKRRDAFGALEERGNAIRPELEKASKSPRPAIAQAAASLLLRLPWYEPQDPPAVKAKLQNYGTNSTGDRLKVLQELAANADPRWRRAALRVATAERSPEVVWAALAPVEPDDNWGKILADVDPATAHPAVVFLLAKQRRFQQDEQADALLAQLLERELKNPTAPPDYLNGAAIELAEQPGTRQQIARRATYLRHLIGQAVNQLRDATLLGWLLFLQAKHGPLPGLATDLELAKNDLGDPRVSIALAQIARRAGATLPADWLETDALVLDNGLPDAFRAQRLYQAGDFLVRLGDLSHAEQALTAVTQLNPQATAGLVVNAQLRLYFIKSGQGEDAEAARLLQAVIATPGINLTLSRGDGSNPEWPLKDVQAKIAWHQYRAAEKAHDADAMKKAVDSLLATESSDMAVYLDILPALEKLSDAKAIDAYFDRVYKRQQELLTGAKNHAMAMNDLAWLCARSDRKLPEAEKYATQAVAAAPDQAAYIDTLAEVKFRRGDVQQAIELEERAKKIDPGMTFLDEQLARFRAAAAQPQTNPSTRPSPKSSEKQ